MKTWQYYKKLGHVEGTIYFLEIMWSSKATHLKGTYVYGRCQGRKCVDGVQ
jgi:hypothetical protein